MKKAALIRKYGKGAAWERAGLYYLDPPMPQLRKDGGHDYLRYVMVMVQGDTADMYEADANGKLTGLYARWTPLTRDDGRSGGYSTWYHSHARGRSKRRGTQLCLWGR